MTLWAWVALALVGGAGAVARFLIDGAVSAGRKAEFPLGTLLVNLSGAFALGVLTGAGVARTWLFVVGTGFIGSFTTFSTWMFETARLAEDGEDAVALANLGVGIVAGLLAAGGGFAIGALL